MPSFCAAYNCANASDSTMNVMFHKFPDAEKDKIRHQKWVQAMKRKNFTPSKNSKLCSVHFKPEDYSPPVISGPLRLKNTAVPSIFDFPDHLQPKEKKARRILVRSTPSIAPDPIDDDSLDAINDVQIEKTPQCKDVGIQTIVTGIEFVELVNELRRDRKNLKEQLRRRNVRVSTLSGMLELLQRNSLLEETVDSICSSNFQKNLPFELFTNEIENASL